VLTLAKPESRFGFLRASAGWSGRKTKGKIMTKSATKERPMYTVSFSRITGQDDHGNDVLGRPREIGAVWARNGDKLGGIINLDIIPTDLVNRNGVLFVVPVNTIDRGQQ